MERSAKTTSCGLGRLSPLFAEPLIRWSSKFTYCHNSLTHVSLCSLEPELHPHLTVHGCRGPEVPLRFLALACAGVKVAKPEVTVGDERTHAQLLGKCQAGGVLLFSDLGIKWVAARHGLGEDSEPRRLVCALLVLSRQIDRAASVNKSLVGAAGQEIRLCQTTDANRPT